MVDTRLGAMDVKNVMLGAMQAKKLMLGTTQVWPQFGFVSASSTYSSSVNVSSSGSSYPVNLPAGSQAGDLLIAQYHFGYNATLGTAPAFSLSGWTVLASYRPGTNTPPYSVATVWAWHPGGTTVNFPTLGTNGVTGGLHVAMIAIRGARTNTPIPSSAGMTAASGSANTSTLPGATAISNQMLVYGFSGACDSAAANDVTWQDADFIKAVDMAGAKVGTRSNWVNSTIAYTDTDGAATDGSGLLVYTATPRLHRHGCGIVVQGA